MSLHSAASIVTSLRVGQSGNLGSTLGTRKRIFCCSKLLNSFLDQTKFFVMCTYGCAASERSQGLKLASQPHLTWKMKMCGVIPPLPHMHLWHAQRNFTCSFIRTFLSKLINYSVFRLIL